ncbi:MAG TPA: hypothetical protein VEX68_19160 [Bryobacteraceae bacterium]|nr:hypothetical protein [Bryobacteraceae bacterium]
MVNTLAKALVKAIGSAVVFASLSHAQTEADRDRRLAELERKVRILDPSFKADEAAFDDRLAALEKRIDEVLARSGSPAASTTVSASAQPLLPKAPLEAISVTGDYQQSLEGETRLPVSGYMDAHFNKAEGEPGRGDFHRFVLLFGHSFSDRIKFWSELELEHALVEGGEEKGEVALEQAYLDFLVKPWLNFRAGLVLSPMGIVNERHEPPSFNGVERPVVETIIIPSTWREMGAGITGDLGRGFRYRTFLMSALDPSGFDAEFGIQNGRTGGFESSFRNPAYAGRLEYAGVRRLTVGISGYTGVSSGDIVAVTPRTSIVSFDGRYSFKRIDLRGLFANTWISKSGELNLAMERLTGLNPNVGSQMRGYYAEPAVHVFPRRWRNDLILFTRYEKYNTQQQMAPGFVPLPEFNRSSLFAGVTFKPNADVALKFDYVFNRNAGSAIRPLNGLNLGLGWWF